MFRLIGLVLTVVALLTSSEATGGPAGRDVPKEIAVPPGYKLAARMQAKGVQIYKAVEGKPGQLAWVFQAPLADLFDGKGGKAGCHYEGPAWEATDGSKVVIDKAEKVKSAQAPNVKNDIPWLLIKVKAADDKAGALRSVVFIQRLQTAGGKPPEVVPQRAETIVGVPYQAVYAFYRKAE